jgi:ABC-type sugar transport system permease subunit/ABC-type glycerol-3-phosphate transport system substrate-binding protein
MARCPGLLRTGIILLLIALWTHTSDAQAQQPIRVEMPVFEGGEGLDFFFECARAYEQGHPGVKIDLYGDPRIHDKVRVRVLERSFPEVTNARLNYWALIRNGDVLPLDTFLDQPNWEGDATWRDSFLPGTLDRYLYEGKTYGIPFMASIYAVWYNKNLFEKHGWQPATTWDEFFALCEQIKAEGLWPLAFQGRYPDYAQCVIDHSYYHLAGSDRYFAQKNLAPGAFDNPEFVESLSRIQRVALNYFQPGAMGMSHTESQLEFFLGHTAMIFCGSWLKSEMLGKIPDGFRLGAFNLPLAPTGLADPTAVYGGSGYYFVMKDSDHPREGVEFLRFMTSRQMAGRFARMRDIPVAITGVADDNLSADMQDLAAMMKKAKVTYGTPPGEGYPAMTQYWTDARFKVVTGEITPAQAARDLEAGAEAVRAQAMNPDEITIRHIWKPMLLIGLMGLAILYWTITTILRYRNRLQEGTSPTHAGRTRLSWPNRIILIGPAFLLYSIFVIVPSLKAFGWSLNEWNGLTDMRFIGLQNFARLLFESDGFWIALNNNLFIMFVIPLFVLPLSLFLAVCISREIHGSKFFRIVFFFPNILGAVAAALLWTHMYNPQGGPINAALVGMGQMLMAIGLEGLGGGFTAMEGFAWLSQANLYWALIPMSIWGACGFNMILFLAAMESIPQSIYEAADIDGASPWRQFRTITLPLIWEVLSISIVFMVIGGMKAFETIWLMTNQTPTTQVHVIGTRMVQEMFTEFKVGEATAIAVLLFIMVFFGTAATLRAMRREPVEF